MRKLVYGWFECGLWLLLLLTAYAQRDAWRDYNVWLFVTASALQGVFASLLRSHLRTPTPHAGGTDA